MARHERIQYRLLPAGQVFAGIGVLLVIALAWEPAFTAPVLAVWLGIATLQLLWPRLVLRRIEAQFLPPPRAVRAGENVELGIELTNTSTWLRPGPVSLQSALTGRVTALAPQEIFDLPLPGQTRVVRLSFGKVNRGRQHALCEAIETMRPFGLTAAKRRTSELYVPLTAWCARLSAGPLRASGALPPRSSAADRRRTARGNEDQSQIRNYRPGDPARAIHWRLSARAHELVVVERQPRPEPRFWLWLDTTSGGWPHAPQFERVLQLATTLAEDYYAGGNLRGFVLNGRSRRVADRHSLGIVLDSLSSLRQGGGSARRRKSHRTDVSNGSARRHDVLDLLPAGDNRVRVADVQDRTVLEV
jgi:uncharacterized protein (DUF58 family)